MLKDFRTFLLRGDVVSLAVAVVIGTAFGAVVTSLVEDLLTPLIAAIIGQPDFSDLGVTVNGRDLRYGEFLNALIAFVSVAAVVFFLVIRPVNALVARARRGESPDPTTKTCPHCLSEIPIAAGRCAYCTQAVA